MVENLSEEQITILLWVLGSINVILLLIVLPILSIIKVKKLKIFRELLEVGDEVRYSSELGTNGIVKEINDNETVIEIKVKKFKGLYPIITKK